MLHEPLPLLNFTVESPLPPPKIAALLDSRIAGRISQSEQGAYSVETLFRKLSGEPTPLWFVGRVTSGSFLLQRLSSKARRSGPVLGGKLLASGSGSVLLVRVGVEWSLAVLLLLWPPLVLAANAVWQLALPITWLVALSFCFPVIALLLMRIQARRVQFMFQDLLSKATTSAA